MHDVLLHSQNGKAVQHLPSEFPFSHLLLPLIWVAKLWLLRFKGLRKFSHYVVSGANKPNKPMCSFRWINHAVHTQLKSMGKKPKEPVKV